MTETHFDRFKYETWAGGDTARAQRWYEELERCGAEDVRARLQLSQAGPHGDIAIGETSMPISFVVHWLAWHDHLMVKREVWFELRQLFWPILVIILMLPVVVLRPAVAGEALHRCRFADRLRQPFAQQPRRREPMASVSLIDQSALL